jgi:hypothetical protein
MVESAGCHDPGVVILLPEQELDELLGQLPVGENFQMPRLKMDGAEWIPAGPARRYSLMALGLGRPCSMRRAAPSRRYLASQLFQK